jgi:hypothetical protein
MDDGSRSYGQDEKYIKNLVGEPERRTAAYFENLGAYWRIVLKRIPDCDKLRETS